MIASDQIAALALHRVRQQRAAVATMPSWHEKARPEQRPPDGDWRIWYLRGGRGGGKTWTGANTLAEWAQADPGTWAIVAPTYADARDKCIEGEKSGLLAVLGTHRSEVDRGASRLVASWNRSLGELRLRNGSVIYIDGADDGAKGIQGYNLRGAWCDEIGLWRSWKMAWGESIKFAVRVAPGRIVATGTPKRGHGLVKLLMADDSVRKSLVRTMDNAANLDAQVLNDWVRDWGGTTIGRQELEGEILEDVEGALWKRAMIVYDRVATTLVKGEVVPDLVRIVVAIDPAVTSGEDADETGIVVDGLGANGKGYTLADLSGRMAPADWAKRAVQAYRDFGADRIVAEANNGGDLVLTVIRTIDPHVPVTLVHASRGKRTRAEPVAALYEQGRWVHVEPFPALEDQMCSYTGAPGEDSPDRMDAHVWAATNLMDLQPASVAWGGGSAWGNA